LCIPTKISNPLPSSDQSILSSGSKSILSFVSRRDRRKPRDTNLINSNSACGSTIPRPIQHNWRTTEYDHDHRIKTT
jgi:hypothetical protein